MNSLLDRFEAVKRIPKSLRLGMAFTGALLLLFYLFGQYAEAILASPMLQTFGLAFDSLTMVLLYALFAAGLLFLNFALIDRRLLEQDKLYQEIQLYDEAPEIHFVVLRLRKRADKARRSGWVALFLAIALIALAIALLLRTIEQSDIPQAEREKVTTLQRLLASAKAARTEADKTLSTPVPSTEGNQRALNFPTINIDKLNTAELSVHETNWEVLASIMDVKPAGKTANQTFQSFVRNTFLDRPLNVQAGILRSYIAQLDLIVGNIEPELERAKKALDAATGNGDPLSTRNLSPVLVRFGAVFILMFLTQTLINLYRYNIRIAAFYDSRADILELSSVVPEVLHNIGDTLSPDSYDFGKPARTPAQHAVDLAKELVSQGGKAIRRG